MSDTDRQGPVGRNGRTVILISGYGRSGSTIVDIELAKRTGGTSVGELRYAARHLDRGERTCSCGERVADCPFWRDLHARGLLTSESVLEHTPLLRAAPMLRFAELDSTRRLFEAIADADPRAGPIIDSSKSAWGALLRPRLVARALGDHRPVVHVGLFREPTGVYRSMRKGRNEDLATGRERVGRLVGVRFVLGWVLANAALLATHRAFERAGRPTVVRELSALTTDFDLLDALGLAPAHGSGPDDSAPPEPTLHMAGGNRLQATGADNVLRAEPTGPRGRDASAPAAPPLVRTLTRAMYARLRRAAGR